MPSDESKRNLTAGVLSALCTAARLAVTWCGATDHARRLHQQVIDAMNKAPMTSAADFDARVYALLDVIRGSYRAIQLTSTAAEGVALMPEPAIVIDREYPTWPTGPQALTELRACREHERAAFWFGFRLAPDGNNVRFRITGEAIQRMPEDTPRRRGARLVAALLTWLGDDPERRLEDLNDFQVYVSDAGDTRIEPYGG